MESRKQQAAAPARRRASTRHARDKEDAVDVRALVEAGVLRAGDHLWCAALDARATVAGGSMVGWLNDTLGVSHPSVSAWLQAAAKRGKRGQRLRVQEEAEAWQHVSVDGHNLGEVRSAYEAWRGAQASPGASGGSGAAPSAPSSAPSAPSAPSIEQLLASHDPRRGNARGAKREAPESPAGAGGAPGGAEQGSKKQRTAEERARRREAALHQREHQQNQELQQHLAVLQRLHAQQQRKRGSARGGSGSGSGRLGEEEQPVRHEGEGNGEGKRWAEAAALGGTDEEEAAAEAAERAVAEREQQRLAEETAQRATKEAEQREMVVAEAPSKVIFREAPGATGSAAASSAPVPGKEPRAERCSDGGGDSDDGSKAADEQDEGRHKVATVKDEGDSTDHSENVEHADHSEHSEHSEHTEHSEHSEHSENPEQQGSRAEDDPEREGSDDAAHDTHMRDADDADDAEDAGEAEDADAVMEDNGEGEGDGGNAATAKEHGHEEQGTPEDHTAAQAAAAAPEQREDHDGHSSKTDSSASPEQHEQHEQQDRESPEGRQHEGAGDDAEADDEGDEGDEGSGSSKPMDVSHDDSGDAATPAAAAPEAPQARSTGARPLHRPPPQVGWADPAVSASVECPLCLRLFDDPVFLNCKPPHTVCRPCAARLYDLGLVLLETPAACLRLQNPGDLTMVPGSVPLVCPLCECVTYVPRQSGVAALKSDEGAAAAAQRYEKGPPVCRLHGEPIKLFCVHDSTPICYQCAQSHKHEGSSFNVVELAEAISFTRKTIASIAEHGRLRLDELRAARGRLDAIAAAVRSDEAGVLARVDADYAAASEALRARRESLAAQARQYAQAKSEALARQSRCLQSFAALAEGCARLAGDVAGAAEGANPFRCLRSTPALEKQLSFVGHAVCGDACCSVGLAYAPAGPALSDALASWGDVSEGSVSLALSSVSAEATAEPRRGEMCFVTEAQPTCLLALGCWRPEVCAAGRLAGGAATRSGRLEAGSVGVA
eukprot:m51a1_g6593 hypothetical protein (1005) ;mRNA; r:252905-256521